MDFGEYRSQIFETIACIVASEAGMKNPSFYSGSLFIDGDLKDPAVSKAVDSFRHVFPNTIASSIGNNEIVVDFVDDVQVIH